MADPAMPSTTGQWLAPFSTRVPNTPTTAAPRSGSTGISGATLSTPNSVNETVTGYFQSVQCCLIRGRAPRPAGGQDARPPTWEIGNVLILSGFAKPRHRVYPCVDITTRRAPAPDPPPRPRS